MNKAIPFFALILCGLSLAETLTLSMCYEKAIKNHPLQEELKQRRLAYDLNKKNLNAQWLPQVKANAQASYMSNVVEFENVLGSLPIPISPGAFQSMPHDQYKVTLNVTQTIYDGGAVGAAKKAQASALSADEQAVQVEFYKVQEQINEVYFALLKLDKQKTLLDLMQENIEARRKSLASAVENGVILPQQLYVLDAELLKLEQKRDELSIRHKSLVAILTEFIGEPIDQDEIFSTPQVSLSNSSDVARPELELFSKQKEALEAQKKVIGVQRMPKAMLFGTYGYGNPPGNDFFTDAFDDYYIVGAGLSMTILDWRSNHRSKRAIEAQQRVIDAKKHDVERALRIAQQTAETDIERLQSMLDKDAELIRLRGKITASASSQLENGVISATEYLAELNAEKEARLNLELHSIQVVEAKINFLTISGQIGNGLSH